MGAMTELSDEQLVHQVLETERKLVGARFAHSMQQLENTNELRVLRRNIARLLTESRRREGAQNLAKGSLMDAHKASFTPTSGGEAEEAEEKGGFLSGIVDKLGGTE